MTLVVGWLVKQNLYNALISTSVYEAKLQTLEEATTDEMEVAKKANEEGKAQKSSKSFQIILDLYKGYLNKNERLLY